MARNIEQPVTTEKTGSGRRDESVTTHPAFAQIGVTRVSGHTNLYDSDFSHNAFMSITITRSELHRGLSNDWHFAGDELIRVSLSEAQWATFVSSINGSSVPCTLERHNGTSVPGLPSPASRTEQFREEMQRDLADTLKALDEMGELIDSLNLPKGKRSALIDKGRAIHAKLTSSLPFVAEQFDEHMENTVEKAKAEVHGYMTGVIQRAGITALSQGDKLPLQIGHDGDEKP